MRFVAETSNQQQLDQGAKKQQQQQQQQEQQQWKLRPPFRWRSKSAQRSEGDGGDQVAASTAADQNGVAARRQRSASPCSLEQNRSASKSTSCSYLGRLTEIRGSREANSRNLSDVASFLCAGDSRRGRRSSRTASTSGGGRSGGAGCSSSGTGGRERPHRDERASGLSSNFYRKFTHHKQFKCNKDKKSQKWCFTFY